MVGVSAPDPDDVRLAGALVREAGSLAARMRADGVEGLGVEQKTSVSDVVTAADRAAEELVARRLSEERPDDGVLGEEGVDEPGTSGRRWVIDPVDGTYNFLSGLTWWCSAVALLDGDELVLGAIYHHHDDALHLGGPGLPSTRDGVPIGPLRDVPLARTSMATYFAPGDLAASAGAAFYRAAGSAAAVRMLGSGSMDATAVAQGQVGLVLQHSVPPWDELPGAALVRGAGGTTQRVRHEGLEWYAAGAPTAVAQACAALVDGADG
ncbi:myo-inositol-1(or 4)-monophosphatase [Nocardioides zeae]|uniref:Myo-inositol-1(Or 4)-monophosphatase n=1 Tax=Nocardioides zeae TaxID=1457234 RepID=A0ACC6IIK3_9ACTN|nr:myo-inositol-1(or 4)-monophosphatase [Nocardioides zeae]MDR6210514.1 myo-inositol-1(or 4)-monophosphatase [Nocardioides zeae]